MTDKAAENNHLHDDPREAVIEPEPHSGHANNIREEQGTHAAGAVPAAFAGAQRAGDKPEDATDNPDAI